MKKDRKIHSESSVNWKRIVYDNPGSKWLAKRHMDCLMQVYVGKTQKQLREIYIRERILVLVFAVLGVMGCYVLAQLTSLPKKTPLQEGKIYKEGPGGKDTSVELEVINGQESHTVTVTVPAQTLGHEQVQAAFDKGEKYIREHYLGENISSDQIQHPLHLIQDVPEIPVSISWHMDARQLVQEDGQIKNEKLEEPTAVEITACMTCQEEERWVTMQLTILPPERTKREQAWLHWEKKLKQALENSQTEKMVQLPMETDGMKWRYYQLHENETHKILIFGLIFCIMSPVWMDSRLESKAKLREKQLQKEYPEMVEQMVLLLGAGLTIRGAWKRMAVEHMDTAGKPRYLYEEMRVTMREMESGMQEKKAYEFFGKRTGLMCYMRFSTLLVQNLRKGTDDLLSLLEKETIEAFQIRKEYAVKCGEEASTKFLFPMMLMLIVVFTMILYAAFQSM